MAATSSDEIEKVSDSLYRTSLGEDVVEFGDSRDAEFKPTLKLTRWSGEASLTVAYPDTDITVKQEKAEDGRLKWVTPKVEVHFYRKPPTEQYEGGAVEFEIILKEKPLSNIIDLPLDLENLNIYHQPPLTHEFKKEDCVIWTPTRVVTNDGQDITRAEDVVDSYAVYHSSKIGNEYKSGKAFHIFRPKAIDADGVETWCSQRFINDALRITIPQATLDSAKYPIVIDPTFGNTVIPTDASINIGDRIVGGVFTCPEVGTAISITARIRNQPDETKFKCALFKDSDYSFVAETEERTNLGIGEAWFVFNFAAPPAITNQDYVIAIWGDGAGALLYDTGSGELVHDDMAYDGFPDPFVEDGSAVRLGGIYCTYTAAGVSIPVAMHHYSHHINKIIRG